MYVHDIGDQTFRKIAHDLLDRLNLLKQPPLVWIAIGNSGSHVGKAITSYAVETQHPFYARNVQIVELGWDTKKHEHIFHSEQDANLLHGASALLIDSVVNSGHTMLSALEFLRAKQLLPKEVIAFAVAVRRTSSFIPNFFSYSIGSSDRVFLPWHGKRFNNRMVISGIFRSLSDKDLFRPHINTTRDFIDRISWQDRWFELQREPHRRVILCERGGAIAGLINFACDPSTGEVYIDELGTDQSYVGNGIAGALLRYVETISRGMDCSKLSLWAHETVMSFYAPGGFKPTGRKIQCGADGSYHHMERSLGSSKSDIMAWAAEGK